MRRWNGEKEWESCLRWVTQAQAISLVFGFPWFHGFSYTGLSHHFGIPISLVPRIQLHRASVIHSPSFQGENAWCATYPHPRPLIAEPQFPYLRKWKNISPQDEIEQDVWEGLGA